MLNAELALSRGLYSVCLLETFISTYPLLTRPVERVWEGRRVRRQCGGRAYSEIMSLARVVASFFLIFHFDAFSVCAVQYVRAEKNLKYSNSERST